MQLKRADLVLTVGLALLGLYIVVQAFEYGVLGSTITGPGLFPLLSGLMIAIGALGILTGYARRTRRLEGALSRRESVIVGLFLLITLVFLLLVETIGMVPLTPFYVFAIAATLKPPRSARTWLAHACVALGFTLFAWWLFSWLLAVPLPEGLFGDEL